MINFRLTDREYEDLKAASNSSGERCLSDFARTAVLTYARSWGREDTVHTRLQVLDQKLSGIGTRLEAVLERLSALAVTETE